MTQGILTDFTGMALNDIECSQMYYFFSDFKLKEYMS